MVDTHPEELDERLPVTTTTKPKAIDTEHHYTEPPPSSLNRGFLLFCPLLASVCFGCGSTGRARQIVLTCGSVERLDLER